MLDTPPKSSHFVFLPIFLLQLVIAFWSYLILRIVFRMLMGKPASDVREEGEGETETELDVAGSEVDEKLRKRIVASRVEEIKTGK